MEEELPELLQMTSGFREVVYRMYLLGKFKHSRCEPTFEEDNSILHKDSTNVGFDPNKVHWTDNGTRTTRTIDVGDGEVITDGTVIYDSTSDDYYTGDLLTHEQSLKLRAEWEDQQQQKMTDAAPPMDYSIGSMSTTSGSPPSSIDGVRDNKSFDVDVDDDLDEEEQQSLKERFASKLCEAKGLR
jgi:hypothetical protein